MATLSTAIQYALRESMLPAIYESLWELDALYPMIGRTWSQVTRNTQGRGWIAYKTWASGVAGQAKFAAIDTATVGVTSTPDGYIQYGDPSGFPALADTVAPAFFRSQVSLIEQRGNFYLPHDILRASELSNAIGDIVAENIKGMSVLLAQQEAAQFYADASTYALATLAVTDGGGIVDGSDSKSIVWTKAAADSGRIHRFRPGMMVDFYTAAGVLMNDGADHTGTCYGNIVVDAVDPIAGTVTFRSGEGSAAVLDKDTVLFWDGANKKALVTAGDTLDGMTIHIKDSRSKGPTQLNDWIVQPGGTFYGIDVTAFPQFGSLVTAVNAALSETVLNTNVGRFLEALPGKKLNAGITTEGVLMELVDNLRYGPGAGTPTNSLEGTMRYDRQGKALDVMAGWEAFNYRYGGKAIPIYTSSYCTQGNLYLGNFMKGGITRYVPPPIPGTTGDARFGNELEFIGTIDGSNSIFLICNDATTGGPTDMVQAPFVRQWELMPNQANFIKLTGCTALF